MKRTISLFAIFFIVSGCAINVRAWMVIGDNRPFVSFTNLLLYSEDYEGSNWFSYAEAYGNAFTQTVTDGVIDYSDNDTHAQLFYQNVGNQTACQPDAITPAVYRAEVDLPYYSESVVWAQTYTMTNSDDGAGGNVSPETSIRWHTDNDEYAKWSPVILPFNFHALGNTYPRLFVTSLNGPHAYKIRNQQISFSPGTGLRVFGDSLMEGTYHPTIGGNFDIYLSVGLIYAFKNYLVPVNDALLKSPIGWETGCEGKSLPDSIYDRAVAAIDNDDYWEYCWLDGGTNDLLPTGCGSSVAQIQENFTDVLDLLLGLEAGQQRVCGKILFFGMPPLLSTNSDLYDEVNTLNNYIDNDLCGVGNTYGTDCEYFSLLDSLGDTSNPNLIDNDNGWYPANNIHFGAIGAHKLANDVSAQVMIPQNTPIIDRYITTTDSCIAP